MKRSDLRNGLNSAALLFAVLAAALAAGPAWGQDAAVTNSEALKIPMFDSIDENGVDLISGMLRIRSPQLTIGAGEEQVSFGLEWTGRSWRMVGLPMINREDGKYYVTYNGATEEFDTRSNGYAQLKPKTGSTLDCLVWSQENMASNCMYTNRDGDVVVFHGRVSPYAQLADDYGMQTLALGNLGMNKAVVTSAAHSVRTYGDGDLLTGFDTRHHQTLNYVTFGNQQLIITTPNQSGLYSEIDEHYLRPDNITQTITEDSGAVWQYAVNDDREIVNVYPPNGLSSVAYTYTGEHRVTSVTTAAGLWTYTYASSGGYRTITVTAPTGRQYSVKSHIEYGRVEEHRELTPSLRLTTYQYNADRRLEWITYPEGNRIHLEYDSRGNLLKRSDHPKTGTNILVWNFGYWQADGVCAERVLCNRLAYTIDPKNNRTDFEYQASYTSQALRPIGASTIDIVPVPAGHGKPIVIRYPAPSPGAARPTVRNSYNGSGYLTSTATCITLESCAGNTSEEVKTEYEYTSVSYSAELIQRGATLPTVTARTGHFSVPRSIIETGAGVVRRTCNEIDQLGRIIAATPPNANLTSCPTGTAGTLPAYNAVVPDAGYTKTTPTFSQ